MRSSRNFTSVINKQIRNTNRHDFAHMQHKWKLTKPDGSGHGVKRTAGHRLLWNTAIVLQNIKPVGEEHQPTPRWWLTKPDGSGHGVKRTAGQQLPWNTAIVFQNTKPLVKNTNLRRRAKHLRRLKNFAGVESA